LLKWLLLRLKETYHQVADENIYIDGPCVVVSFSSTELNVEVTPILYQGDPQWRGFLWDRQTGEKVLTSIPMHLEFIRKRKDAQPAHFAQVVRLLKWWVKQRESDTPGFAMRSFLVELLLAKIADNGAKFDDYHVGLEHFFLYIQRTGLKERIAFTDNYRTSELPQNPTGVVEIFDPVNPKNNVASNISEAERRSLVEIADRTLDALSYARTCQTKGAALECWQEVLGASFNA
jgi:hypothetical protein